MRINNRKNFKFSLNFSKFLLKFSEKLLKFSIKFPKIVQTLTNFSQITIVNLIYNKVYLNYYKFLQTLINFIKFFLECFLIHFRNVLIIFLIFKQISNLNNFSKHSYIFLIHNVLHVHNKFENFYKFY